MECCDCCGIKWWPRETLTYIKITHDDDDYCVEKKKNNRKLDSMCLRRNDQIQTKIRETKYFFSSFLYTLLYFLGWGSVWAFAIDFLKIFWWMNSVLITSTNNFYWMNRKRGKKNWEKREREKEWRSKHNLKIICWMMKVTELAADQVAGWYLYWI